MTAMKTPKPKATSPNPNPTALRITEWDFMTLDEWRQNPSCVAYVSDLLKTPMFRKFMGMLHNHATQVIIPTQDASREIGRIEGARHILNVISASGYPIESMETLEAYALPE